MISINSVSLPSPGCLKRGNVRTGAGRDQVSEGTEMPLPGTEVTGTQEVEESLMV